VPIVNLADFARIAKISKPAVTKAIGSGRLIRQADGKIDTENPVNANYLALKQKGVVILPHAQKEKPAPPEPPPVRAPLKPPARATVAPPAVIDKPEDPVRKAALEKAMADGIESVNLDRARKKADLELKRQMAAGHAIRNSAKKGTLIEKKLVIQKFASFDAALKSNFRDMPRRVSAQIHAIAAAQDARAVEAYLEREIGQAIARAVEAAKAEGLE
jgi:hypothetical protein